MKIAQPAELSGVDVAGSLAGMYRSSTADSEEGPGAQILASGIAVAWAREAQALLRRHWRVHADVWSVTSWTELRRDALAADEWNCWHPAAAPRTPYLTARLRGRRGPVVAVSDSIRAVPDQVARFVEADWSSLGTDGFGVSDTRPHLARSCGVEPTWIVLRVLELLAHQGEVDPAVPTQAIERYGLVSGFPGRR